MPRFPRNVSSAHCASRLSISAAAQPPSAYPDAEPGLARLVVGQSSGGETDATAPSEDGQDSTEEYSDGRDQQEGDASPAPNGTSRASEDAGDEANSGGRWRGEMPRSTAQFVAAPCVRRASVIVMLLLRRCDN